MIKFLLLALALVGGANSQLLRGVPSLSPLRDSVSLLETNQVDLEMHHTIRSTNPENGCITFSVGQGTGCDWMCNYCSNMLGTNNYYFTDNVCTYETDGCVGNPIAGKQYTCCSASDEEYNDEL